MFRLDVITVGLEFLRTFIYEPLVEIFQKLFSIEFLTPILSPKLFSIEFLTPIILKIYNYFYNYLYSNKYIALFIDNYIPLIINSFSTITKKLINLWFEVIPLGFYKNLSAAAHALRYMFNLRLLIGWFPSLNPHRGVLAIITEPIDLIVRPLYGRVPKIHYSDLSYWIVGFILDVIVDFFDFLVDISSTYNSLT